MPNMTATFAVLVLALALPAAPPHPVKTCTAAERATIGCSSNNGTGVTVNGDRSSSPPPGSSSGPSNPGNSGPQSPGRQAPNNDAENCGGVEPCMRGAVPRLPGRPPAPALPTVTISDLASFSPASTVPTSEPSNVGIAGMPTNFVAAASAHTRTGTLFGLPITVRFTPVGYDFDYGDGSSATLDTGGETWTALGQAQFTPTATSHVYSERGTYDAAVTIRYTAEVDLGTGWIPVDGQISAPGPVQQIRVYEANTALVGFTCAERPTAPGC